MPRPDAQTIRQNLRTWFQKNGRDLPWRRTQDPYAIMVSEFMLQQTTVTAVIPYFERWMATFPTPQALAAADEQTVLHLWQGLGYYSRARNLHKAAKAISSQYDGKIPADVAVLRSLPGVGDYTAGAVVAFAFDAAVPVIDANIARVLARLNDYRNPIDDTVGKAFLTQAAAELLPQKGGRIHTSALMELGALVCLSRKAMCLVCPVKTQCKTTDPESLPLKRARAETTHLLEKRSFIFERDKLWLQPSIGPRWKGLWLLPESQGANRPADHVEIYPITRYRITMYIHQEAIASHHPKDLTPFSAAALPPMPSPHKRAVEAIFRKIASR